MKVKQPPVAFQAENFHGVFRSVACGGHLYLVFALCEVTIWRHIHASKPMFWQSLLTQYAYFSKSAPLILCVIALNINYQRSKLGHRRKINSQRHDTAVYYWKNIRLQVKTGEQNTLITSEQFTTANKAALTSCRIGAVEQGKCATGLAGAHSGLKDRILPNYTRIENEHKVRKKTFDVLWCIEVQQIFSFPFSLLRHHQMPECFHVLTTAVYELVQQFYHATEIGNIAAAISACANQP